MNRPPHGAGNPTPVDEATDAYDTIEWLVKNIPESNGKVGTLGISYDGFEPLMALVNPHPALKVSVPMNPMVDGWMGDGLVSQRRVFASRIYPTFYEQVASRDSSIKWWTNYHDDYDLFMQAGSAGELAHRYGMEQLGFWNKIVAHPAYDAFWSEQGGGQGARGAAVTGAGDAGAQPVGPRRQLRGTRGLCSHQTERYPR